MGNVSLCRPPAITLEIAQMGVMKPTVQVRTHPIFRDRLLKDLANKSSK